MDNIDFLEKITLKIKNKAKGYEIAFEIESYRQFYENRLKKLNFDYELERSIKDTMQFVIYSDGRFKRFGENIISESAESDDKRKSFEYKKLIYDIQTAIDKSIKEIGYLEFKKFKGEPEVSEYSGQLNDFIIFFDKKYKEWKETRG